LSIFVLGSIAVRKAKLSITQSFFSATAGARQTLCLMLRALYQIKTSNMKLLVTDPIESDAQSFHNLILEPEIQREFPSFKNRTFLESKNEIDNWSNNWLNLMPSFMRLIKVTKHDHLPTETVWTDENSKIIGFIVHSESQGIDKLFSGMNYLLNFAITKNYWGQGIMTTALKLALNRMYENEINIASAFVKSNNIASKRVLEKNGFDLIRNTPMGMTYIKPLYIDINIYNKEFKK
jgi:RimJ/RimL family protein N-acetyltransferase